MSTTISKQIKDQTIMEAKSISVKSSHIHERNPVDPYKIHVSALQALIPKFSELWERAESEESALAKVTAEREAEKVKLYNEKAAHTQTKGELSDVKNLLNTTKQQLKKESEDFQKEKTKMAEEITKLLSSLADVKKERDSLQVDLENKSSQLKKESEGLEKERANSVKKDADLANAKEIRKSLENDLDRKERDLDEANTSENQLREDLKEAQRTFGLKIEQAQDRTAKADQKRDKVVKELEEATKTIRALKDSEGLSDGSSLSKLQAELKERTEVLDTYLPPPDKRNQRVYIHKAIYGGVVIENPDVLQKLQQVAESKSKFTVSNAFCGGDPWRGTTKTFVVSYMTGGKGPMKYYCAQEGKTVEFP